MKGVLSYKISRIVLCVFLICTIILTHNNNLRAQSAAESCNLNIETGNNNSDSVQNGIGESKKEAVCDNTVSLYDWFRRGGFFMWPILFSAALAMGLIIERFLFYRRAKLKPAEFIEEINRKLGSGTMDDVIALCNEKNMVISRVLLKGLNLRKLGLDHVEKGIGAAGSIEVASLEKGLSVLSAIGNIAPLIGFLGTVSGMITAFQSIAAADQVSARLVAGGIYEALITTEAGLIVAIPVLAFYNFFVHRIETFVADIERISSDIAEKMLGENG